MSDFNSCSERWLYRHLEVSRHVMEWHCMLNLNSYYSFSWANFWKVTVMQQSCKWPRDKPALCPMACTVEAASPAPKASLSSSLLTIISPWSEKPASCSFGLGLIFGSYWALSKCSMEWIQSIIELIKIRWVPAMCHRLHGYLPGASPYTLPWSWSCGQQVDGSPRTVRE